MFSLWPKNPVPEKNSVSGRSRGPSVMPGPSPRESRLRCPWRVLRGAGLTEQKGEAAGCCLQQTGVWTSAWPLPWTLQHPATRGLGTPTKCGPWPYQAGICNVTRSRWFMGTLNLRSIDHTAQRRPNHPLKYDQGVAEIILRNSQQSAEAPHSGIPAT